MDYLYSQFALPFDTLHLCLAYVLMYFSALLTLEKHQMYLLNRFSGPALFKAC